jgi:pimeloyl-ACP methyl ester carboxylesterase
LCALFMATILPFTPAASASQPSAADRVARAVAGQGTVPFTPVECPVPSPEGIRLDCGYLTVAESRRNYTGKTIDLAIAILRSPNPTPAPDPMIFLAGGPGQGALALAPFIPAVFGPTLAQRDIILIDQRGTGYSRPSLRCTYDFTTLKGRLPITASQESDRPAIIQSQINSLLACGEQYRAAGIDLRAYNSVENAADLEDLRRALGYGAWNVYGGSYGSRLALTAMQYRPETLRAVVLESIYPPQQANFHVDVFSSFNRSLSELFGACAADAACNTAYPNLADAYDRVIAQLNASPAQVPIINPGDGSVITYLPVSGVDVGTIIFQLFYITPVIPLLPALIGETANGNYEILGSILGILLSQEGDPAAFSLGMQVAVQCNEDATYASADDFVRARDSNRRAAPLAHTVIFNEAILQVCAAWGLGTPEPGSDVAVSSNVRAFVIGGQFDPITPPRYTDIALQTLGNTTRVEYPRGGHTPSTSSPCLIVATAAFFANPAATPDTSCIAQEAPLPFITP